MKDSRPVCFLIKTCNLLCVSQQRRGTPQSTTSAAPVDLATRVPWWVSVFSSDLVRKSPPMSIECVQARGFLPLLSPLPPPRAGCSYSLAPRPCGSISVVSRGHGRKPRSNLRAFNYQEVSACLSPASVHLSLSLLLLLLLLHPQGFQVVCEAAQSDSSSPSAGEQSCRRGNSVEKGGGPSQQQQQQQPPTVKGPSKKKWAALISLTCRLRGRGGVLVTSLILGVRLTVKKEEEEAEEW